VKQKEFRIKAQSMIDSLDDELVKARAELSDKHRQLAKAQTELATQSRRMQARAPFFARSAACVWGEPSRLSGVLRVPVALAPSARPADATRPARRERRGACRMLHAARCASRVAHRTAQRVPHVKVARCIACRTLHGPTRLRRPTRRAARTARAVRSGTRTGRGPSRRRWSRSSSSSLLSHARSAGSVP
jgi:hypothetical protein